MARRRWRRSARATAHGSGPGVARLLWPLLPWLAGGIALAPLLLGGFPRGHDWSFELVRVAEFRHALADGQWIPAWAPNLYGGYGSPIFLFYAPAFSLVASAVASAAGGLDRAACLALAAFTAVAVVGMRRLLRRALGDGPAEAAGTRVGVYLFVLNPYLIGDALLRNANAEYAALCLAPLPLAALPSARSRPLRAALAVGAGLAAVILTHNLTALTVSVLLAGAALFLFGPGRDWRAGAATAGGVALGLALAAFFWAPAAALAPLVRTEDLLTGKFDFHVQFPSPTELFRYRSFFAVGALGPLALLAAAFAAWRGALATAERRLLLAALLGALAFAFLATPMSVGLWERLPLLPFYQFPWRHLGAVALATAVAGAIAFTALVRGLGTRRLRAAELGVFLACIANALPHLIAYQPLPERVRAGLDQALQPAAIRRGVRAATVGDEYLPRGAVRAVAESGRGRQPLASTRPPAELEVRRDAGTRAELSVRARAPTRLELSRWAFPGWEVRSDGRPLDWRESPRGTLAVDVPAGVAEITLRYRTPRARRAALAASALAAAAWLALAWRARRGRREGAGATS